MEEAAVKALCDQIRQTGFDLHCYLGPGQSEKVYENGLANRLRMRGLQVEQQKPIQVLDEDGTVLGDFYADLVVNDFLIIELKAAKSIVEEHMAQLFGYLRSSGNEHGLLINFGARRYAIRKVVCDRYNPEASPLEMDASF